jgi:hypothetical protein
MRFFVIIFIILLTISITFSNNPDEGMYPLSEIEKIDFKESDLKIKVSDIYNSNNLSLIDAIVKIGGCTGSFVSPQGLIITNHHCAYRAAQAASSEEHDYIQNGFIAHNREQEIEAKGYTIRITKSYKDVSAKILASINNDMSPLERSKAINKRRKELVKQIEEKNQGLKAEVAEMFKGKSYLLFIYTFYKDVRLVYVPPRSIGNFGGEVDNWEWPRHTGDFSFLRVYTAPDGTPASYAEENIPLKPKKYLKVSSQGVEDDDFVFILGYPGRTYRHRSSYFLHFEETIHMPFVVEWYQWLIKTMEDIGKDDRAIMLKHLSKIKGLANTEKNYRGKLQGMRRLHLVETKRKEEQLLELYIRQNKQLHKTYGTVLNDIDQYYKDKGAAARHDYLLSYLRRNVTMLSYANTVYFAGIERKKKDIDRKSAYMDRNYDRTIKRLINGLQDYYEPTDKIIFKELISRILSLPDSQRINAVEELFRDKNIDQIIDEMYANNQLKKIDTLQNALTLSSEKIAEMNNPFINFIIKLKPEIEKIEKKQKNNRGILTELSVKYTEMREKFLKKNFIPDANGTLRLTYGYIRGYAPADAIYKSPITSLNGIMEKNSGKKPFDIPQKLITLHTQQNFSQFYNKKLKSIPVNLLYNCDTTGGNSGSPILNGSGELIGVNFDRAFEATINDFGWSEEYSRSIGVDIRYTLWILEKYAGANYLLHEMGISD